jgi:hypothetical protein
MLHGLLNVKIKFYYLLKCPLYEKHRIIKLEILKRSAFLLCTNLSMDDLLSKQLRVRINFGISSDAITNHRSRRTNNCGHITNMTTNISHKTIRETVRKGD